MTIFLYSTIKTNRYAVTLLLMQCFIFPLSAWALLVKGQKRPSAGPIHTKSLIKRLCQHEHRRLHGKLPCTYTVKGWLLESVSRSITNHRWKRDMTNEYLGLYSRMFVGNRILFCNRIQVTDQHQWKRGVNMDIDPLTFIIIILFIANMAQAMFLLIKHMSI